MLAVATVGQSSSDYVDDMLSTYSYTGNGTSIVIDNGMNVSGVGGLVWIKARSAGNDNVLFDTVRGAAQKLVTDTTAAQAAVPNHLTAFGSTGFALGSDNDVNRNGGTHVSWTFLKHDRFFDVQSKSHVNGVADSINLSSLGTVGMVVVKRTDGTSNWFVWHRSQTSGKLTYLQQTSAETTDVSISVTGTTLTLDASLATGSYIIYAWAHDTLPGGKIQCGSFTTDGSGQFSTIALGWEPQFLLVKRKDSTGDWVLVDSIRAFCAASGADRVLLPNSSAAEGFGSYGLPTADGLASESSSSYAISATYEYMAIRRPDKPPTTGTQIYKAVARAGTGATATVTGVGFPPDTAIICPRNSIPAAQGFFVDRLRGTPNPVNNVLAASMSNSELGLTNTILSLDQDGMSLGADGGGYGINNASINTITYFLKRAVGVHDVACYAGDGASNRHVNHSLSAIPELILIKNRSVSDNWVVRYSSNVSNNGSLNSNASFNLSNYVNDATATYFQLANNSSQVNNSSYNYVAYLFATLAGISKVFSYTGNGTNQIINCGFASGARFVMIKRMDSTGDWFVWDAERGIVAGNDPHLSLNTTVAEVTTDDSIDPSAAGFIVNQLAATNVNINGGSYIGLAFA